LAGDFFFKKLQPCLEEADFGDRVVRPRRAGLEGRKSDQRPSREGLFLVSQFHSHLLLMESRPATLRTVLSPLDAQNLALTAWLQLVRQARILSINTIN